MFLPVNTFGNIFFISFVINSLALVFPKCYRDTWPAWVCHLCTRCDNGAMATPSKCPICADPLRRPDIDKLIAASMHPQAICDRFPDLTPAIIAVHTEKHCRIESAQLKKYQAIQHREALLKIGCANRLRRLERIEKLLQDLESVQAQRAEDARTRRDNGLTIHPGDLTGLMMPKTGVLDVSYIASVRQLLDAAGREMSALDAVETPDTAQGKSVTIITGSTSGPVQIIGAVDNHPGSTRDDGPNPYRHGGDSTPAVEIPLLKRLEMQLNQADQLPSAGSVTGAVLDGEYSVHESEDADQPGEADD
jgi:hypothetical protein